MKDVAVKKGAHQAQELNLTLLYISFGAPLAPIKKFPKREYK